MKRFVTEEDYATARDAAQDVLERFYAANRSAGTHGAPMLLSDIPKLAMDIVSAVARSDAPIGDITDLPGIEVKRAP